MELIKMKSKNINNERMKIINSKVVLNYIREKVSASRKVIADEVGLTQSTVTNIIHELIEGGYVIETGKGESDGGRRPVFLQLNAKAGYAIGIELNEVKIWRLATKDAHGLYKKMGFTALKKPDQMMELIKT